ncbi:MAG: helix-turn-helix transcriptional regulator [Burkholderiaceae bacterium]
MQSSDAIADRCVWSGLPPQVTQALAQAAHARVAVVRIPLQEAGGSHHWLASHWPEDVRAVAAAAIGQPLLFPALWPGGDAALTARFLVDTGHTTTRSGRFLRACQHLQLACCVRVAIPLPLDVALECLLYFGDAKSQWATDAACGAAVLEWLPLFRGAMRTQSKLLTPREVECLRMAFAGLTAGEVASRLDCSDRTVNFHYANLMTKLGVKNKLAAALLASWLGLI